MVSRVIQRFTLKAAGAGPHTSQKIICNDNNHVQKIFKLQAYCGTRKYASTVSYGENNLLLMGSPGSGKTTIGRLLSPKLGMPVLDIDDDFLEVHWNTSVADKLSLVGADRFIQEEGEALLQFNAKNCIVSLTGSNPLHGAGMRHVSNTGTVLFLDVNPQDILNRLEIMKVNRIVGQGPNFSISDVLQYRQSFYEDSYDVRIICEQGESPESISDKILEQWKQNQKRREYISTRNSSSVDAPNFEFTKKPVHFLDAVLQGLAPDGGLYVPARDYPKLSLGQWERLVHCSYQQRALCILEKWIHPLDIHPRKLNAMIQQAYGPDNFENSDVVPVVHLHDNQYVTEVFHGPTASFKDAALQLMPQFFTEAVINSNQEQRYLILVATSGDTGSAVLDGFAKYAGASGSMVMVLYPEYGVSPVQKSLMTSAEGSNVHVVGVDSDFDFCQSAIKNIFNNTAVTDMLQSKHRVCLSAANSINWGRLLPQVVYHASAYLDLVKKGVISLGDGCDVCVPTGNFGNILGAVYAKKMGIPIRKFICASNENNVLTEFFKTGVYDIRHRSLQVTMSPAIDILKSSNLERFLHLVTDGDGDELRGYFEQLNSESFFKASPRVMEKIKEEWGFVADWCSQEECANTIKNVFQNTGYLLDPHTAVAKTIANRQSASDHPMLISATAHYGKFASDVAASIGVVIDSRSGQLEGMKVLPEMHQELARALHRPRIHNRVVRPSITEILSEVMGFVDRAPVKKVLERCV